MALARRSDEIRGAANLGSIRDASKFLAEKEEAEPEPPEPKRDEPSVLNTGDRVILGDHWLFVGDATKEASRIAHTAHRKAEALADFHRR